MQERNITQLKAFVNIALKKGHTKLKVKQEALKAGWTKEEINKALNL